MSTKDENGRNRELNRRNILLAGTTVAAASVMGSAAPVRTAQAQTTSGQRPNIIFIMGDDIGWFNIGAYHRGMMAGRTPNLDKLAAEGMMFTDYYAEASCTAGRANFITGELPIRTGLTTVGQAGATIGMPAEASRSPRLLKSMGYATGQFGKNHLGDLNEFLPTVHGFDEFFGYLYHLDAMEDPATRNYPPGTQGQVGPRNMLHCWATDTDDTDRRAALGQSRQAENRGRRHALSEADGNRGRRDPRPGAQVHRQGQEGRQAVLPLAQPDAHARRHASLGEIRDDAQRRKTAGASRKPAWRSSTTSSAR